MSTPSGFSKAALDYFAEHAIDPAIAAEVGVRQGRERIFFPNSDEAGTFERWRLLNGSGKKFGQPTDRHPTCWWPTGRAGTIVLVCEGEPDALAALSVIRGGGELHPAAAEQFAGVVVCAVPGASFAARLAGELDGFERVILASDGDGAGDGFARKASAALSTSGIETVRVHLPAGADLADCLAGSDNPADWLANAIADAAAASLDDEQGDVRRFSIVTVEEFAAVEEPGAAALLGTDDAALIAEGSDVLIYGDGGAGKTTLVLDLAFHLAGGTSWLGIPVARRLRLLLIESEGPRPMFRAKTRRKLAAWTGPELQGRVGVFAEPWGEFVFTDSAWREALAERVRADEIDVLIAGPVNRLGMTEAGTIHEVREFMAVVDAVRRESGRRVVVILVHHESKSGAVSGAWEGAGDTLLRVEAQGNGHTHLRVQKARWSSTHHGSHLDLAWTDGEGFAVEGDRDYHVEIDALLADGEWRTVREIAAKRDASKPGIGAQHTTVKEKLEERPEHYVQRNGGDVGRSSRATVWQLASTLSPVGPVGALFDDGGQLHRSPYTPEGGGGECSPVLDDQPQLDSGGVAVEGDGG